MKGHKNCVDGRSEKKDGFNKRYSEKRANGHKSTRWATRPQTVTTAGDDGEGNVMMGSSCKLVSGR